MKHFEIHQTLELNGVLLDTVKSAIDESIKIIKVESLRNGEVVLVDPMTSYRIKCKDLECAKDRASFVEKILSDLGVKVIRTKIESDVNYDAESVMYYESHLQIKVPSDEISIRLDSLQSLCSYLGVHLSRNAFKKDDTYSWIMVTSRATSKTIIEMSTYNAIDLLTRHGFIISDKIEIESVLYDTNLSPDDLWTH
jgi:hypothetical protein